MRHARLNIKRRLPNYELTDLIKVIQSNVKLESISFDIVGFCEETTIYFSSNDFIDSSPGLMPPSPQWNGVSLDFSNCWESSYLAAKIATAYQYNPNFNSSGYLTGDSVYVTTDDGITLAKITNGSESMCNHNWMKYTGLMDSFDYCTKCGEKKL